MRKFLCPPPKTGDGAGNLQLAIVLVLMAFLAGALLVRRYKTLHSGK